MSGPVGTQESLRVSAPMWPRRRWLAVALLVPVLGAVILAVTRPAQGAAGPGWWVLLVLVVLAGAGTLASYVPASGVRPDVGCTPCAAVSALTVVAAVMLLRDAGPDLTAVALAAAVSIFGLGQRLSQPRACVTPGAGED